MNHNNQQLNPTVKLGQNAHQIAKEFRRHQANFYQAQQVYLNTLAVYAVNDYLKNNGIKTNLETSDSWHPVIQSLADIADLQIQYRGEWQKIECRPVFSDTNSVYIPAEVWEDRIGYIAVQINEYLTEATLLGFVKIAATEELPLSQLQPLDGLLEELKPPIKPLVSLSRWFENIVEAGWQTVEDIFNQPEMSLAFRGVNSVAVKRKKTIQIQGYTFQIILDIRQESDGKVRIHPNLFSGANSNLPNGVNLILLDETGNHFLKTESLGGENLIKTQPFKGKPGECFTIKIALGEESVTEEFII